MLARRSRAQRNHSTGTDTPTSRPPSPPSPLLSKVAQPRPADRDDRQEQRDLLLVADPAMTWASRRPRGRGQKEKKNRRGGGGHERTHGADQRRGHALRVGGIYFCTVPEAPPRSPAPAFSVKRRSGRARMYRRYVQRRASLRVPAASSAASTRRTIVRRAAQLGPSFLPTSIPPSRRARGDGLLGPTL